jgi:hypothetical protein
MCPSAGHQRDDPESYRAGRERRPLHVVCGQLDTGAVLEKLVAGKQKAGAQITVDVVTFRAA